jgi:hypothetical protein
LRVYLLKKPVFLKGGYRMADHWIQGAIKHPGALHKKLKVPKGKKIPESKIKAAEKKGGKLGKEAHLADTLKKLRK